MRIYQTWSVVTRMRIGPAVMEMALARTNIRPVFGVTCLTEGKTGARSPAIL